MAERLGKFINDANQFANLMQEYQRARKQQQEQQQYPPQGSQQQQHYPPPPPSQMYGQQTHPQMSIDSELERLQRERDEQLKIAQQEIQRLRNEQEQKIRDAERELERMRLGTVESMTPTPTAAISQAESASTTHPNIATGKSTSTPKPSPNHTQCDTSQPEPPLRHPCGVVPITECIESPMAIELDWFAHPAAPDFLICSRCYVDHVYGTAFAAAFQAVHHGKDPERRCMFGTPRVRDVMWPASVASTSLTDIVAFMQKRQSIPSCAGKAAQKGDFYKTPEIPETTICPACYEDYLAAWPTIGDKYRRIGNVEGYCDGATHYFRRMLEIFGPRSDWEGLKPQLQARMWMAQCSMTQDPSSLLWYVSTKTADTNLLICGACYCDYFYNGPEQASWQETHLGPPPGPGGRPACALGTYPNVAFPADRALDKKNYDLFWQAMAARSQQPLCSGEGESSMRGATWYALKGAESIVVCGACYGSLVYSFRGCSWFAGPSSPPQGNICLLNHSHPQYSLVMQGLIESYLLGSPKPLIAHYQVVASAGPPITNVQPCPRNQSDRGGGRRWWGWDALRICEACYVQVQGQNPQTEQQFQLHGDRSLSSFSCDLYSTNMRRRYQQGDVASLLSFARHRRQVYDQVTTQMDLLQLRQKMDLNRAHTHGLMANMTKFQGDISTPNSYVTSSTGMSGYFFNDMSLKGALDQRAAAAEADAALAGTGIEAERRRLLRQWHEWNELMGSGEGKK